MTTSRAERTANLPAVAILSIHSRTIRPETTRVCPWKQAPESGRWRTPPVRATRSQHGSRSDSERERVSPSARIPWRESDNLTEPLALCGSEPGNWDRGAWFGMLPEPSPLVPHPLARGASTGAWRITLANRSRSHHRICPTSRLATPHRLLTQQLLQLRRYRRQLHPAE